MIRDQRSEIRGQLPSSHPEAISSLPVLKAGVFSVNCLSRRSRWRRRVIRPPHWCSACPAPHRYPRGI